MNLKKIKIISVFGIFIMCFIVHYIYEILPCSFTSIFFPVNESIWEHMKLLFTAITIYSLFEYILIKNFKILYHNFIFMMIFSSIIIIPIFLTIFLPVYNLIGENLIITIFIMLFSIIVTEFLSYFIIKMNLNWFMNYFSILLYIICYIIFGYLTYNPILNDLFKDPINNKYGVNIYIIK